MLVSFKDSSIFLATPGAASASMEAALKPRAQVMLMEPRFGQHMGVAQMLQRFGWMFGEQDVRSFFVFGILRNPVAMMLSRFNARRSAGAGSGHAADMRFAEFVEQQAASTDPDDMPQHRRFLDADGRIGANYLITLDKLPEGLAHVGQRLGWDKPPNMQRLHRTEGGITRDALAPDDVALVRARFKADFAFLAKYGNVALESFTLRPDL